MTTSTKKVQAWTNEMVATLTEAYTGDNSQLQTIADQFNKSVPMVRSKLVNLGVYKANTKRSVGNASSIRKMSLVRSAEAMLSLAEGSLDSFEKGSKAELTVLNEALIAVLEHQETK